MALNLKTLATRSFSAIVFVVVLVACLLWNYYSFTIFFLLVAMLGLNEFYKLAANLQIKPFKALGYFLGLVCYLAFTNDFFWLQPVLVLLPFLIFTQALFSKDEQPVKNALFTLGGIAYAVLPFALLQDLVQFKNEISGISTFVPEVVLGVILLIWSNDTFAYLGGSLFGKHKMSPRISPGKTWEGTIFGIVVTFGLSFLLKSYFKNDLFNVWLMLGALVPVLATTGDLVESMLKRQANVKDSGNIMPGHGGILDRFDSLIFVSPFVYVLFKLL
jgi:phosphatidate cytidylyltransferase